jgi:preprotein translocase subunit SecD
MSLARAGACALILLIAGCDQMPWGRNQPGSTLVLEVNGEALRKEQLEQQSDSAAQTLRTTGPPILLSGHGIAGDAIRFRLADPADAQRAFAAIAAMGGGDILVVSQAADGALEARLSEAYFQSLLAQVANQSVAVLERRVTALSRHATVAIGDDNRLTVHAPGIVDPSTLESLTVRGVIGFHLVRGLDPYGEVPATAMVAQALEIYGGDAEVVERRPRLTGANIDDARPTVDPSSRELALAFRLDQQGARVFCRITREHTGDRFAILLDNQVLTAPVINEPICGGSAQISGNFTKGSAEELAVILIAGALPAPLKEIELRGPDVE